jgi:CRISPR/Cas system-associated endoribonuclease Cas2
MHFFVADAIVEDGRRDKAANALKNFGLRIQYSA